MNRAAILTAYNANEAAARVIGAKAAEWIGWVLG